MATQPQQPQSLEQAFDSAFDSAVQEQRTQPVEAPEPAPEPAREQPEAAEAGPAQATESPAEQKLLTAEEEKLTGKDREQALNRAWTQKTQALAGDRKRLEQADQLYQALEADPAATLRALSQSLGIAPVVPESKAEAVEATDEIVSTLEKVLGPEIAQQLSGAIGKIVEEAVRPVIERDRERQVETQVLEARQAFQELKAKHPGAERYDHPIAELARKIQVVPGTITVRDYVEMLYFLASRGDSKAEQTKALLKGLERSASASESSSSGTPPKQIAPGPPPEFAGASLDKAFDIAFAASKRGETWD